MLDARNTSRSYGTAPDPPTPAAVGSGVRQALHIAAALRLVWRSCPGRAAASVLLLAVQCLSAPLFLYLTKLVIDALAAGAASPDKPEVFQHVLFLSALAGIVALVNNVCSAVAELISTSQAEIVSDYVHGLLHGKTVGLDLECFENADYHDLLRRVQRDGVVRPPRIVNALFQAAQHGVSLLLMAGLLVSFHWWVVGVLFVAAIPAAWVRQRQAVRMYQWHRQKTATERLAHYYHGVLTGDRHAKELRLFNLGGHFAEQFRRLREWLRRGNLALVARTSWATLCTQAAAGLVVMGVYVLIAFEAVEGQISLGALALYYQAVQRGQAALKGLTSQFVHLYEDSLFLSDFYTLLRVEPRISDPPCPCAFPPVLNAGIAFDHVSFRYPGSSKLALDDVVLTVRPGELVALVGENGAGKSTLVKLLCRLYDPTCGRITVDGIDLRSFRLDEYRKHVSAIFQDYVKYQCTARENIRFGNVELPPDDDRIVAAARLAGADKVVEALPHAYDTTLGKLFEAGQELSIGEWQKVALARAYLRDAPIVVLDEPTSAMDPRSEADVFCSFLRAIKGRMSVVISHRLWTARVADRIYVIERGRVADSGTHDELVGREGAYAFLYKTQARRYR